MAVPNTFATKTGTILLSELDTNFATPITIGSTSIALGDTKTIIEGVTLVAPALGTPSVLVGTNITGTATAFTATTVTTNANLTGAITSVGNATSLGSFTSANLATALTDETGSGANVFATSPTLVTPILGTPTSGTLTNCTLPQLSASTGSTLVGTTNGGTGSVTRTVASKLNDTISVKDFGAVGNGVTNDTAAIQAALAAISANGGGLLRIPKGTYLVSGALNVPGNCSIYGDGVNATIINGSHNGVIFNCLNRYFTIENMSIIGPNNIAYTSCYGIYTATVSAVIGANDYLLKNLFIQFCYDNIYIAGAANCTLETITVQQANRYGIYGASAQGKWSGVSAFSNKSTGIYLTPNTTGVGFVGVSPFMMNIETFANGGYGIYVGVNSSLMLTNSFLNNDSQGEIYFDTNSKVEIGEISNTVIQFAGINPFDTNRTGPYAGNANAAGIYVSGGTANTLLNLSNITTFGNSGCDIKTTGAVVCTGSTFFGSGKGLPAVGSYPAVPANTTDVFAFKAVSGGFNILSGCYFNTPVELRGNYNNVSGCSIVCNSATIPAFAVKSGINNIFSSSTVYQNNGAGVNFSSDTGSTYNLGLDFKLYGGTTAQSGTSIPITGKSLTLATGTSNGLWFDRIGVASQVLFKNASTDVVTLENSNAASLSFGTNATERMSLNSTGSLILVGSTAQKATGTTWSNPSDIRLKDNITEYAKGLDELMQVSVKEWDYNGKGGTTEGLKGLGVIADEVMLVLPNTVDTYKAKLNVNDEEDSDIKKFDATEITWLMLKSIQELKTVIDTQNARIETLEAN